MNTNPEAKKSRSLDPNVDLRTIPSGWDLSGFYTANQWVNEPQNYQETHHTREDEVTGKPYDAGENAV